MPSATIETALTQRDRHLQAINERGRMAWRKDSGYNMLARAAACLCARFFQCKFGFAETAREGSFVRFAAAGTVPGGIVDIRAVGGFPVGRMGRGSVHHIAFRAADDAAQAEMVRKLAEHHGLHTTEQKDRNYFRSVYFREPGGILFEIATDDPGFAADEPLAALGQALKLPRFLERHRPQIEAVLPAVA